MAGDTVEIDPLEAPGLYVKRLGDSVKIKYSTLFLCSSVRDNLYPTLPPEILAKILSKVLNRFLLLFET